MDIDFTNSFYLAPYNAPSVKLYELLKSKGFHAKGFIDNVKTGDNIFNPHILSKEDIVIFAPSKFRVEIALKLYQKTNCWFYKPLDNIFMPFSEYKSIIDVNNYEVLFLPYNKSNVIDAALVLRELLRHNITGALIDISHHYCEQNNQLGLQLNLDLPIIDLEVVPYLKFKALVCAIDWERTIARPLISYCQERGVKTIGMVDGIEDFEDADYKFTRNAYNSVEYVLATGLNDANYLKHKQEKVTIIGLPKIYDFWNSEVCFPNEKQIMINVNFTYGTFEEVRDEWLATVLRVCKELNLPYIISHHHADKGDLSSLNVSKNDVYTTIKESTLVISRFSTVILESLALGKPVVYFNPHQEKVKLYKDPQGAYSIACNETQLKKCIIHELSQLKSVRTRARHFLHRQCNILEPKKPVILAREALQKIIKG